MKKILIIAFVFVASTGFSQDFRGFKWNTLREVVQQKENDAEIFKDQDSGSLLYTDKLGDMNTLLTYEFENHRLTKAQYFITRPSKNTFVDLEAALKDKYKNCSQHKDQTGVDSYHSVFITDTSKITLTYYCDFSSISIVYEPLKGKYHSVKYSNKL
jgi:hypothetical protein